MYCSVKFLVPIVTVGPAAALCLAAVAVPPKRSATPIEMAKAAFAARRVCFLNTFSSSLVDRWSLGCGTLSGRGRTEQKREQQGGQQCQRRDAERCRHHARDAVAGLVIDDLAEPAAARDCRNGRRGDHENRSNPYTCSDEREAERQLDTREDLTLGQAHPP